MDSIETVVVLLAVAAFLAGFVDSVVGGGGLIQIPALFSAYPSALPATLFGTNKVASIVGTASAAVQYARRIPIAWNVALPAAGAALVGSWLGASAVVFIHPDVIRPLILVLLVLVAIYTFSKKDFGTSGKARKLYSTELGLALLIGGGIGFYDGFFGPGTGSFLIFLFVRFLNLDFLSASAMAKVVNVATNFSALTVFATSVEIFWKLGLVMALCNLSGALVGSRLALRKGAAFVRKFFLVVVLALILKMAFDLFVSG